MDKFENLNGLEMEYANGFRVHIDRIEEKTVVEAPSTSFDMDALRAILKKYR